MNVPPRKRDRLKLGEVERLHDVAGDLLADRTSSCVVSTSRQSREAARIFVASLREKPVQTLRELIRSLRQARTALRDPSMSARGGDDHE